MCVHVNAGITCSGFFWNCLHKALLIHVNRKWNAINSHVIVCIFVRAIGYGWCARKQACVWMEHEGHINAIRRGANMLAVKFFNVTVPCSFTSDSNECISEATGWSPCRAVHLHPSVFPPHHASQAPLHSIPSMTHRMQWHDDRTPASAVENENLYHSTL